MEKRYGAISNKFQTLKQAGHKALLTYLSAGDPDLHITRELVLAMEQNGADIIELGIPYSDPIADGPVIQEASLRALKNGITTEKVFGLVESLRQDTDIPLIAMVYYNTIMQYGLKKFLLRCSQVGIDGLIVPDLPLEESEELRLVAEEEKVDVIMLVAPTTPIERISLIAQASRGFLYCVAVIGVTGMQKKLDSGIQEFMSRVRSQTDLPLALGFGISTPEQVAEAAQQADGVIVGSAVIKVLEENLGKHNLVESVKNFVGTLKAGSMAE